MKKYKHGMVLGKFYPPHNGHVYLIEEAFKQCETVSVFVCSLCSEFPHGMMRTVWLNQIFQDNDDISIIPVNEELPQTPEEHGDFDDFYKIWCNVVNSRVKNLDAIFTSENYGDEFADKLGIEHVLVDIDRRTYNVSGTAVRNNPIDNWKHIPQIVRPFYKKKILIMGTESTGKTTLTNKLAEHFNGDVVAEYGREYVDKIKPRSLVARDFDIIANTHNIHINDMLDEGPNPLVFIDTDAIVTKIFGEMYLGDDFNSHTLNNIIDNQKFDLILVCDIDVPWIDDGTRDFPNQEDRKRHLNKITNELHLLYEPYKMIRGNYDERLQLAIKYVEQIIN